MTNTTNPGLMFAKSTTEVKVFYGLHRLLAPCAFAAAVSNTRQTAESPAQKPFSDLADAGEADTTWSVATFDN